ncbi:MAG: hypothetical protein QW757_05130 [Candidatus Woesearchaeota archaeon]
MFNDLFSTFLEFLYAPLIYKEMLWILLPLFFAIALMEIYFYKYPREGFGHHKSLESSIFLIFVYFDLIRYLINYDLNLAKALVIFIFLIFTLIVSVYDFFHKLPLKTIFKMSSKSVIAFFTYITIVLVYSDLLNNESFFHLLSVFFALILFFFMIVVIRFLYSYLEPRSYEEMEKFLENVEKDIKKLNKEINDEESLDEKLIKNKKSKEVFNKVNFIKKEIKVKKKNNKDKK